MYVKIEEKNDRIQVRFEPTIFKLEGRHFIPYTTIGFHLIVIIRCYLY